MAGDEILAISFELQRLTVILANQIAQPRLCEPNADAQLRSELPLQFLRCCVDGERGRWGERFFPSRWLVRFGMRRERGVKQSWSRRVDRPSEEHETFSENIRSESTRIN